MVLLLQLETVAAAPLNVTVPAPWDVPKLAPVIVTAVPGAPEFGCTWLIPGGED
jgi:hypothetical protein